MTDQQLVDGAVAVQSRFNELLFQLAGNQSDTIPNLSDLAISNSSGTGDSWVSTTSFKSGDIVSYNNNIYISKVASNLGYVPDVQPTYWGLVSTSDLLNGSVYAGACCWIKNGSQYYDGAQYFVISDGWNMTSLTVLDQTNGVFRLQFDPAAAGVVDTNYLVICAGHNAYNGSKSIFNVINILERASAYITFKMPSLIRGQLGFITIIPNQK
jgi:hypothetical protein